MGRGLRRDLNRCRVRGHPRIRLAECGGFVLFSPHNPIGFAWVKSLDRAGCWSGPDGPFFVCPVRSGYRLPIDTNEIARLLEPSLEAMGYRLVRLMQTGGLKRPTLQLMAERRDDVPMTVE